MLTNPISLFTDPTQLKQLVMDLSHIELEPYFLIFSKSEGMHSASPEELADPASRILLAVDVGKFQFNKHAKFEYFGKAKDWWDDGMQSIIASHITLANEGTAELYCFYNAQNNNKHPMLLGKLLHDEFHSYCLDAITKFGSLRR